MDWKKATGRDRWRTFERAVINLHNEEILTLETLDKLGELFRGLDVPYTEVASVYSQDDQVVEEIALRLINSDTPNYVPPYRYDGELWDAFGDVAHQRWGWE